MVLAALLTVSSVQLPVRAEGTAEKLTIAGLTASSEYAGNLIGKANDGDAATFWETDWRGSNYTPSETNPIVVTASFAAPTEVGTMKIVQRKGYDTVTLGQPNGRFIKAKYTFLGENDTVIGTPVTETYELNENNIPLEDDIVVDVNQTVKSVKIEILQAYHTTATMAELEFYAPAGTGEPEVPANGITAIEANTQQTANNQGIEKAIDGDPATFWHSAWSGFSVSASNPAVVTITRPDGAGAMGELLYTTRPYGGADGDMNGNILQMNIYTSNDKAAWVKLTDVTWDNAAGTKSVNMKANTDKYVKLEITSGYRNFATAAEFSIAPFDNDVSKVDISLMETVRELGLSETDSKGWTADSAQALLAALNTAQAAYDAEDVLALIAALEDLQAAYHALTPDKQPLQEMIVTTKATSCVGMNQSSVANLKRAIANAEAALKTVANPLEVQFEIGQLEEAIAALSPEAAEDIQDVTGLKALQRENNFNEGWLFQETTADLSAAAVDEAQFESVNLPHDFSISKDFTTSGEAESGFLQGGTGWYRKHLTIPAEEANKNFTLVFDGAYMDTTVYVNGEEVGQNHNGYNQFAFDITDKLVCDGTTDNVIAVKVVNDLPSSRWYSGSGIYRDVTLQVTNATHVDYLGMFVATPEVSATEGTVKVTNTIVGKTDDTKVKTVIYDKDGKEVAASELTAVTADKAEQTLTVANPELWTVKTSSPALYKAVTAVYNGETKVDEVESTFGFKYVEFDRETGFSLNGENMKLKGVCMHHDQGALGAAANYHAVYRQMKIMKDMGANAIRVTHNPASEALLRACDELGLLVINEAFDHFYYSKNLNRNDFARWFKVAIGENGPEGSAPDMIWAEYVSRQMVKTSRNHASMLMYSVGNELLEGGGSDDGYIQMTADVCSWFAAEDPYHKPTIGDNHAKNNNARALAMCDEVSKAGGIVGLNYTNPTQYQSMRDRYPNWIIYGSETSSANHSRGVYNTEYKDLDRLVCSDYENEVARVGWGHSASTAWKHVADHAWNLGEFVWTGFDYLGEPTPWNNIGAGSVSGKGAAPVPASLEL